MQEYVVGFLVDDPHEEWVLLVRKNRPTWQAGRLNGIGGKIEPGETPVQAMIREFAEETGLLPSAYSPAGWKHTVTLTGPDYRVYFFLTYGKIDVMTHARQTTDEAIGTFAIASLGLHHAIPNILWIIPLSLNQHISGPDGAQTVFPVEIEEARRG